MSFQFSLETVLRFRKSLEAREEALLLAANQLVVDAQRKIATLAQELSQRQQNVRRNLQDGLCGAELVFEQSCELRLEERLAILNQQLLQLEAARQAQMNKYQHARRQRLLLDQLREKAHQAYLREEERLAQRRLDDLFLLRREFLKRG